jgi:hypothetical protein
VRESQDLEASGLHRAPHSYQPLPREAVSSPSTAQPPHLRDLRAAQRPGGGQAAQQVPDALHGRRRPGKAHLSGGRWGWGVRWGMGVGGGRRWMGSGSAGRPPHALARSAGGRARPAPPSSPPPAGPEAGRRN